MKNTRAHGAGCVGSSTGCRRPSLFSLKPGRAVLGGLFPALGATPQAIRHGVREFGAARHLF